MSPPNKVSEISDSLQTEKLTKETFLYFAYGSNMLTERLRERCSSAKNAGIAVVKGYHLSFSKKSVDDSGKTTLVDQKSETVFGVLFGIDKNELSSLDEDEKGYDCIENFQVSCLEKQQNILAITYIAKKEKINDTLIPYDWYNALVLAGAIQHSLPSVYIETIRRVKTKRDPKPNRPTRKAALKVLALSGFAHLLKAEA